MASRQPQGLYDRRFPQNWMMSMEAPEWDWLDRDFRAVDASLAGRLKALRPYLMEVQAASHDGDVADLLAVGHGDLHFDGSIEGRVIAAGNT
jgi:hypothetical protein